MFTQEESHEDREKATERTWHLSCVIGRRAPINGMERENTAGRRNSANQVQEPHTSVKCGHVIHWVNQSLGKHYYVPSMFLSWVEVTQTGIRSGPTWKGLL